MLNRNAPRLQLFVNQGPTGNALELRLAPSAVARVEGTGAFSAQLQRGFASAIEPVVHAGLGKRASAAVEVEWRPGVVQRFGTLDAGFAYVLAEGAERPASATTFKEKQKPAARVWPKTLATLGLKSDGRPTVVQVFAQWCKPCAAEVPVLDALHAAQAVRVVGLAAHEPAELEKAVTALGMHYPAEPLGARAELVSLGKSAVDLPTVLVFDRAGELQRVVHGPGLVVQGLAELERR